MKGKVTYYEVEGQFCVKDAHVNIVVFKTIVCCDPGKGPRSAAAATTYAKKLIKRGVGPMADLKACKCTRIEE